MKVLDLFSGIGGFSLGLERAGFETVAFCEIEPFCQKVLKKHWPNIPIYEDIRKLKGEEIGSVDLICGGFPCQDISVAGKQVGIEGERSGLWEDFSRLIGEIRPRYAIVENVTALISGDRGRWFGRILGDLAEIGYDCEWHCIPASELGANHHRDRVWIIAYSNSNRPQKRVHVSGTSEKKEGRKQQGYKNNGIHAQKNATNTRCGKQPQRGLYLGIRRQIKSIQKNGRWKTTSQPIMDRGTDGIRNRLDRLRGLGNAVVPQVPEIIGRAIMEIENETPPQND